MVRLRIQKLKIKTENCGIRLRRMAVFEYFSKDTMYYQETSYVSCLL